MGRSQGNGVKETEKPGDLISQAFFYSLRERFTGQTAAGRSEKNKTNSPVFANTALTTRPTRGGRQAPRRSSKKCYQYRHGRAKALRP